MVGPACTQFQEKPSCTSWVVGNYFSWNCVQTRGPIKTVPPVGRKSPKDASGKSVLRHTNEEEEDPFDSMDDYEDLRLKNNSL